MRLAANEASSQLDAEIRSVFGWPKSVEIEWCSPVRDDDYAEYYDEEFLERLGVSGLRVPLSEFWPKSGPRWDALARTKCGKLILVEAKAYPEEAVDYGSQAGTESLARISAAIAEAKAAFGASEAANWLAPFYQYANRLAHLYFLAERNGLDAYLVFLYFANANDVPTPCSETEWRGASRVVKKCLGLPQKHRFDGRIASIVMDVDERRTRT